MLVADMLQRADHSIEIRFAADEAVIRKHVRARREMFAGAKADLDMQRSMVTEQGCR